MTGKEQEHADGFAKIRAAVERVSRRGNIVDPLDVADLALVLSLCPPAPTAHDPAPDE